MTWVLVARETTDSWVEFAAVLVDTWCLGVKDAYVLDMPRSELDAVLEDQLPENDRQAMDPACARKLIEGSVAYAQSLGFLPHRDFRKARRVLGKIDAKTCTKEFCFGRDGKPCFVAGPDDDEARVNRVLAILNARFGPGGFTHLVPHATEENDTISDAVEPFYEFIEEGFCRNESLSTAEADGFVTGLHLLPETILPSEWLCALWGGEAEAPTFPDEETAKLVVGGVLALYQFTADQLCRDAFVPALPEAEDPEHRLSARGFAEGLLRGLSLRPSTLAWLRGHPDAAAAMALLDELVRSGASEAPEQAVRSARAEAFDYTGDLADAVASLYGLTAELRGPGRQDA